MKKVSLIIVLIIFIILHLMLGKVYIPPVDIVHCFQFSHTPLSCEIIYQVRLPRTLSAIIIGILLTLSGYILQQVSQNPIFEPGVLGVNAGALFMMTCVQLVTGIITQTTWIMLISIIGGVVVLLIITFLTRLTRHQQSMTPILGLLMGQFLTSIVYFILLIRSDVASDVMSKTFGSLNGTTMQDVYALLPFAVTGVLLLTLVHHNLKYFNMNETMLINIGFAYQRWTIIMLLIAVFLASITVPIIGTIGFVGLMSPHIGKMISRQHPLRYSACIGALILLVSDIIAAGIFLPALKQVNIPLGAILSIVGAPYFVLLYFKQRKAIV